MAHECPECGQVCYCGGDIDDLCLNDDASVNRCSHCDTANDREDDDPEGCCYEPGQCCMPGPHRLSECHTADMIETATPPPAQDAANGAGTGETKQEGR
jgi:hypothetical protein